MGPLLLRHWWAWAPVGFSMAPHLLGPNGPLSQGHWWAHALIAPPHSGKHSVAYTCIFVLGWVRLLHDHPFPLAPPCAADETT